MTDTTRENVLDALREAKAAVQSRLEHDDGLPGDVILASVVPLLAYLLSRREPAIAAELDAIFKLFDERGV